MDASAVTLKDAPWVQRESHLSRTLSTQDEAPNVTRRPRRSRKKSAWKSIVQSLAQSTSQPYQAIVPARVIARTAPPQPDDRNVRHVIVEVLERTSACSAIISWHDSTRCNYGFQAWRRIVSTRTGVCAVSGTRIRLGDSIYKPDMKSAPLNASAMILATEVESCLIHESIEPY
jgi:hypothetical protein